jgi:RNA polymerase sigma-70 factor (ECF subfamily)
MCQTAQECVTLGWQPFGGLVTEGRDERELVRRCREGSEAAYAELVRTHRPRLYLLAYRLVGDRETAEDVVQETFLAAFRSIEKVEPRPSLNPWLNTIVLRTASRAASRRRSRPGPSLDQARQHPGYESVAVPGLGEGMIDPDPSSDPHAAAEAAELRRDLAAALIDLPFKYRAAVVLRHVMGLDYAEAALQMDVPLNTFKSHLLRGTRMLREAVAVHGVGPGGSRSQLRQWPTPGGAGGRLGAAGEALTAAPVRSDSGRPAARRYLPATFSHPLVMYGV